MGNAVQDPAPTRQAQPPELPKWGVGGSALLPGRLFSPSSRRRHLSTVSAWHRSHCPPYSSPKWQWDAAGPPPGSCIPHAHPHPPPRPLPTVPLQPWGSQPNLSGCPGARSLPPCTLLHLLVIRGAQGWAGLRTSPNSSWKSLSKAREQIRDFTLPMFLQLQHTCTARTSLF